MVRFNIEVNKLGEICREHRIEQLAVFGSRVRGESRPDSDWDILVSFEPNANVGLLAFSRLARELESILGSHVDLVTPNGLHPRIRDQVLAEAEVIFAQ